MYMFRGLNFKSSNARHNLNPYFKLHLSYKGDSENTHRENRQDYKGILNDKRISCVIIFQINIKHVHNR